MGVGIGGGFWGEAGSGGPQGDGARGVGGWFRRGGGLVERGGAGSTGGGLIQVNRVEATGRTSAQLAAMGTLMRRISVAPSAVGRWSLRRRTESMVNGTLRRDGRREDTELN